MHERGLTTLLLCDKCIVNVQSGKFMKEYVAACSMRSTSS